MMAYQTVYPYFEMLINNLIVDTQQNIEFRKFSDPNIPLLKLIDGLEYLKNELERKPTISNVNFEKLINSTILNAKSGNYNITGVRIMLGFTENADTSMFYPINLIIPRK